MTETATTTAQVAESTAAEQHTNANGTVGAQEGVQSTQTNQADNKGTDFDTLIQRAVDRATNKLGNENKKLRGEIETLKKASMTDAELRDHEMKEKEKEIAEREKAITDKENRWIALKEIKAAGLDDGGDASMALVDFIMADDEATIKERVKAFDTLVKGIVEKKVDAVFKANGRTPGVGTDSGAPADTRDSIAVTLGKNAAATNERSRAIIDSYKGGSKK